MPQLGPRATSGLRAVSTNSRGRGQPTEQPQPLPRVHELAGSKAAHSPALARQEERYREKQRAYSSSVESQACMAGLTGRGRPHLGAAPRQPMALGEACLARLTLAGRALTALSSSAWLTLTLTLTLT